MKARLPWLQNRLLNSEHSSELLASLIDPGLGPLHQHYPYSSLASNPTVGSCRLWALPHRHLQPPADGHRRRRGHPAAEAAAAEAEVVVQAGQGDDDEEDQGEATHKTLVLEDGDAVRVGPAVGVSPAVGVGSLLAASPAGDDEDHDAADGEERDEDEAKGDEPVRVARRRRLQHATASGGTATHGEKCRLRLL